MNLRQKIEKDITDKVMIKLKSVLVDEDFAIIDDRLAYSSEAMAQKAAKDLGIEGVHEHEYEGKIWYMVGETHELDLYGKCPKGYKKKNGKCVKK